MKFPQHKYDYVITGAGCAGLSLLMRMVRSGRFADKKILLIDRERKTKNDRTWCFWEKKKDFFEEIVFRKWKALDFWSDDFSATLDISPYEYKMIRGIDFYTYCYDEISKHPNLEIIYGEVDNIERLPEGLILEMNGERLNVGEATAINSIPLKTQQTGKHLKLLQHFKGWVIETPKPVFDPAKAILMDFRIQQEHGTAFVYVLPFSESKALVEYTLFTPDLLKQDQYDAALKDYINQYLGVNGYKISEEEFGVIPMTNEKFRSYYHGVFQIGTTGGQTKASSGYTFQFIQKQAENLVNCFVNNQSPLDIPKTPKRFSFYDNTLLYILYHNKVPGKKIFTDLFQKNDPRKVLKFLDNETTIKEELKIISSLPTWPFLKAAFSV
jgi:lycopene beta-cyclase